MSYQPHLAKFGEYFMDIPDKELSKDILSRSIRYYKALPKDVDKPVLSGTYTCNENSCDFTMAKLELFENPELRKEMTDVSRVLTKLVHRAEDYPSEFIPHKLNGYEIYQHGLLQVRLENKSIPPTDYLAYGAIDCKDVKHTIDDMKKEATTEQLINTKTENNSMCSIQ